MFPGDWMEVCPTRSKLFPPSPWLAKCKALVVVAMAVQVKAHLQQWTPRPQAVGVAPEAHPWRTTTV
jgi:hypothetical protein